MANATPPLEAYNFLESYEALAGAVEASEECALELPERQGARLNRRVKTLVNNILQYSNRMTQGQGCTQADLEPLFREGARQVRYWLEACATSAQRASAARDSYNASLAFPDHRLPPATQHPTALTNASRRVRDSAALRLREGPILRGQTHYDSLGLTGAEKVAKALQIPEFQGALQMVGGGGEAIVGTLIWPLGAPIVAHGVDQAITGAQTFALGKYQPTMTERLLHKAGLSRQVAAQVDVAASLVGMTGGGVAAALRTSRAAQLSAPTVMAGVDRGITGGASAVADASQAIVPSIRRPSNHPPLLHYSIQNSSTLVGTPLKTSQAAMALMNSSRPVDRAYWFHATDSLEKLVGIITTRRIKVTQSESWGIKGAFVSTIPENGMYGNFILGFNRAIERVGTPTTISLDKLSWRGGGLVYPTYWAGFEKTIPVTAKTLEVVGVFKLSAPARQHLSQELSRLAGRPILVMSGEEMLHAAVKRSIQNGIWVPVAWSTVSP